MPNPQPWHDRSFDLSDLEKLRSVYATTPGATSLVKESDHVHPLYRPYIETAPFVALATLGPQGLDVSPRCAAHGNLPRSVLVIEVQKVFFQCARALMRSGLWAPERWPSLSALPTPGAILGKLNAAANGEPIDGAADDAALRPRQRSTLY